MAEELQWLTKAVSEDQCVTFSSKHWSDFDGLASGYRRYAATLRTRALLFGSGQPLLDRVADVAEEVAEVLAENTSHRPVESNERVVKTRRQLTTGYISTRKSTNREISSTLLLEELNIDGGFADHHLQVSWLQEHSPFPRPLDDDGNEPREYNGLLPRLIGHRYERDLASGNYRLHLHLGEIYFRTYQKEYGTPSANLPGGVDESPGGLLTLSLLPVTRDGHMILAQRGTLSFYPECWGPGAGGNLEVMGPGRANPDADPNGIINPLRAIAREAREEIGLSLPIEQIRSLGLARLSNSEERSTWLLATTATIDLSLQEFTRTTLNADPVNGRWEVGKNLAAVPVPRTRKSAEDLLSWTLRNPRAMPHLSVTLLKLITTAWPLDPVTVAPRPSDEEELPPGGRSFRFGDQLEMNQTDPDQ